MVDRYAIIKNPYSLLKQETHWDPIYNAHPTQKLPIIHSPNTIKQFHWGLMAKWSNNKVMSSKLFNLGVARAFEKTSFRKSLLSRRCVAIADGYYQWRQIGKKQHTPHYHYLQNQQLFGIAGIWESSEDLEGKRVESFMCLMDDESADAQTGEGKPVIISANDINQWVSEQLSEENIRDMIMQSGNLEFASHPVSPAISSLGNNNKQLIEPAMPADQHGNYTLF